MIMDPERAANLTEAQWARLLELGSGAGSFNLGLPKSGGDDVVLIQNGQVFRIRWDGGYSCRRLEG